MLLFTRGDRRFVNNSILFFYKAGIVVSVSIVVPYRFDASLPSIFCKSEPSGGFVDCTLIFFPGVKRVLRVAT